MSTLYRRLPSVDVVLARAAQDRELTRLPRNMLRDLVNDFLNLCREEIRSGVIAHESDLETETLWQRIQAYLRAHSRPHFRRVINATGVVIHTNLGRSVLTHEAAASVSEACRHYSNLEFSLDTGQRGSRYSHVEDLLCRISGAEAGLVVNNNAAAVLLVLDTLAKDLEVVVSRSQLVEIGGSFRIPEVMAKSGAYLKEVGATNRTHLKDYRQAIGPDTGAIMKVHTSNYRIIGFYKEVPLKELVQLGLEHDLPVIEDMGSGNFFDFQAHGYNFMPEPTVQQVIRDGASVVSFSGDKLLGGPQAGIILGEKKYIDPIKKNPMNRALRIDKMTLAALESTLRIYLDPELARSRIPTLRMITAGEKDLLQKARRLKNRIRRNIKADMEVTVFPAQSRVGGGAFPEQDLPTSLVGIKLTGMTCEDIRSRLLNTDPPLVGRVEEDFFCLDSRTIDDSEFGMVVSVLAGVVGS